MTKMTFTQLDPIAVANFVVTTLSKSVQTSPLTNLKLQKILFYLQAASLIENDQPLMKGLFVKWQYGPVLEEAHYAFNDRGATPILEPASTISLDDFKFKTPHIKKNFVYRQQLTEQILALAQYSAIELVHLTQQQSIWAQSNGRGVYYTNDEIKSYFKTIEPAQIWHDQLIKSN